ncbi:hypothetical protein BC828DRAFT_386480 [Blastocladiella britannica]|nr:hypothetical protein BC828DRAFT_386480 [Blastocladiella britannica]
MGNRSSSPIVASDAHPSSQLGGLANIPSTAAPGPAYGGATLEASVDAIMAARLDSILPPPHKHPLCVFTASDPLIWALETFCRRNISSLPIQVAENDGGSGNKYALLDTTDVMAFCCARAAAVKEGDDAIQAWSSEFIQALVQTPCMDVVNFSAMNPTLSTTHSASVLATTRSLLSANAHRLLVYNDDARSGFIEHVVTQTHLLQYLHAHLNALLLPSNMSPSGSVASLSFFPAVSSTRRALRTLPASMRVCDAWTQLVAWGVHRAPVVYGPDDPLPAGWPAELRVGIFGAWDAPPVLLRAAGSKLVDDDGGTVVSAARATSPRDNSGSRSPTSNSPTSGSRWGTRDGRATPDPPSPGMLPVYVPIGQVARPACVVDLDDSLASVVLALATKAREVIAVDGVSDPVMMATQGDCIRFVLEALDRSQALA